MMMFDPKSVQSLPLQYSIRREMDSVGLDYYKAKKIK